MPEPSPRGPAPLAYREARWERSIETGPVDEAAVRRWLAPWPELAGRPWRLLAGGLRAVTLRIGEDLVLRAGPSPVDLAKEAALLRFVADRVRVPRVVGESREALLLEHVPHVELPDSAAAGTAAGRAAARLHAVTFDRSGFLDARLQVTEPFPTALEGLRGWAETCLAGLAGRALAGRADAIRRAWDRAAAGLREATERAVLVHADFKPANVKWLATGDVVVFDWEFAWAGPALMDVGQMFRWETSGAFREAFEAAYRAGGGRLPRDWPATAALLDLFHLVGLLDHARPMPVRDRDVLARIDETLRRTTGPGESPTREPSA